ncbi:MAG: hypothetical protein AAF387_19230 [Pseudomonadota bacterium]
MISEKRFFWRFASLPILVPIVCGTIIFGLQTWSPGGGIFGGLMLFMALSGVIGGIPYLLTLGILFGYLRRKKDAENNYLHVGTALPFLFVVVTHLSGVLFLMAIEAGSISLDAMVQLNLELAGLDLICFLVACGYTFVGSLCLVIRRQRANESPRS